MYLPYAKGEKSQHCSEGVNVTGYNVNGSNYVVRYTAEPNEESALNATWYRDLIPKKDVLLDYVL
ncbi:hypothetical protein AAVH_22404 [Aphelenchoides avenae]|nr:hypothetical protein AAVH_22404 [Aphelenchus avenae]